MDSLAMKSTFWQGKRVLVTGHTGFKGSWLSLWLQQLGAQVIGFATKPPTTPNLFSLAQVAANMHSVEGDVRDLEHLQRVFDEQAPEIVFHMAAQPLVRYSYANPVETYATNVMGTVHLLEAVRHTPSVRSVVVVTSDKCYENQEWVWGYRENEPMGGHDAYSNSKGCAELVTSAYRRSYFAVESDARRAVAVGSGRAGNVIGGGDWAADRLIPDIIRAFGASRSVNIRNPHAIRPWQHVLEPLSGYMLLAERLWADGQQFASGWNFGPSEDDARPVEWIVAHMARLWGEGAAWELDASPAPHEAHYLKLDCSRARTLLGWQPRLDLAKALEWTVEWYRTCLHEGDLRAITEQQIRQYESLQ